MQLMIYILRQRANSLLYNNNKRRMKRSLYSRLGTTMKRRLIAKLNQILENLKSLLFPRNYYFLIRIFLLFFPLREILHQCLGLIKKIKLSTVPLYFSFVEKGTKKGIKRSFITADLIKESRENFEGEITGNMLSSHDVAR